MAHSMVDYASYSNVKQTTHIIIARNIKFSKVHAIRDLFVSLDAETMTGSIPVHVIGVFLMNYDISPMQIKHTLA